MKVRSLVVLFLACALTTAHTALVHARGGGDPLTPDEEREARELAATFARRFRETRDIAPLVGELFVEDFAARLQRDDDNYPTGYVARGVLAQLTRDELLSFYVAWANFTALTVEYWTFLIDADDSGPPDGATETERLEGMFPAEAVAVLKEEPNMIAFFDEGARAGAAKQAAPGVTEGGGAAAEEEARRFIKSAEQLRRMTSTIARAVPLIRAALRRLYAALPEGDPEAKREPDRPEAPQTHSVNDYVLDAEAYGRPAGTRLISVSVKSRPLFQFQVYAIRAGGRLRILNVVAELDDD